MRLLLTSTSFQDTPGRHHEELKKLNVEVDELRGPLPEQILLPIIHKYHALICGDDDITKQVLLNGRMGKLKYISKYGIGLDKIDLETAVECNIEVRNCVGVNHITVAEHVFGLLLAFTKNIPAEHNITRQGQWKRLIGHEMFGKTIAIIGLGQIGREVAKRANAFGLVVKAFDKIYDKSFCEDNKILFSNVLEETVNACDYISIHLPLNNYTKGLISEDIIQNHLLPGCIIVNTARAGVVHLASILTGLEHGAIGGYLTDVLEKEPMEENHPLLKYKNVIITPHIGSRTYESVERQGIMAVDNLAKMLSGAG
jgi:D-3-phosphoglycerate dehydrogenase / 2-oxoglutarate reductase